MLRFLILSASGVRRATNARFRCTCIRAGAHGYSRPSDVQVAELSTREQADVPDNE
jgi:hypothetical protein